VQFGINAGLFK